MKTYSITPRSGSGPSRTLSIEKSSPDLSVFNQTSSEAEFAEVAAFFSSPTAFADRLILSRALIQSPYVYRAHDVWMQIAQIPIVAERRTGPGPKDWDPIPHPATARLNRPNANPESDACSFVGELLTSIFNAGEYRVWKLGAGGGTERNPVSLIPIPPGQIVPKKFDPFGRATLWEWIPSTGSNSVSIGPITIPSEHLLSYKEFTNPWEPNRGIPRSHPAAWSIRADFHSRRHNASLAANSGRVDGAFLYDPDKATVKDLENQKRLFDDLYGGSRNAGSTAHLTAKDYKTMIQSAKEMDWIEGAKMTREEILLLWGVFPETQGFGATTFANREAAERALWEVTLAPLAEKAIVRPFMRLYEMDPDRERLRFQFEEKVPALRTNQVKEAQTDERRSRAFLNLVQGGASIESAASATGFNLAAAPQADPVIVQEIRDLIEAGGLERDDVLLEIDRRIERGLAAVETRIEATRRSIPLLVAGHDPDPDGPDTDPEIETRDPPPESLAIRAIVWKNLDSQAEGYERRVRGAFSRFLNDQRKRILKAVDALNPTGAASLQFQTAEKGSAPSPADLAAAETLFDLDAENLEIERALGPVIDQIVADSGRLMEIELDDLGIPGDAETALPGAQADGRKGLEFINRTTLRSLAVAVRDAQADADQDDEPESEKGIGDVVARVGAAVRGVFNKAKGARAKLVASTTAGRSMNAARHEVSLIRAVQANEWLSQRDGRVRNFETPNVSHVELDGRTRTPGESYKSGIVLRYPHDPEAPIAQTANCRCYLVPQVVEYIDPDNP